MNVTTATPAEIDTELARLEREQATLEGQIELLKARMVKNSERIVSLNSEYIRRGTWTRVYRVNNSNGHVHDTTACRNTRYSTEFVWFPQYSGLSAEEIVELAGEYTCLTCFGAVRADILKAREGRPCRIETDDQRKSREEREAAAKALAEKRAVAASKAITDVDGSPLRDGSGFVVKTEVTAQRYYVEAACDAIVWNTTNRGWTPVGETSEQLQARCDRFTKEYSEVAERLLTALAAKRHGVTEGQELADAIEVERAAMAKKVDAKVKDYNKNSKQIIVG